jgi:hypothetical protein
MLLLSLLGLDCQIQAKLAKKGQILLRKPPDLTIRREPE